MLNIPKDYEVIFLQGGATLQFSMIPLNFSYLGKVANFAEIGSWSSKAIKEASNICEVNICTSSKNNNFTKIENFDEWNIVEDTSIVHYCKNETIQGIRVNYDVETNHPLFVDMSSCLFSEIIDIKKYDFIYACAQKNFGPSGITLVILKKELLEKSNTNLPNILKYDAHAKEIWRQAETDEINVRQVMERSKAAEGNMEMPTRPNYCNEEPPEDKNVFSDGAVKFPNKQVLAIGGCGIWCLGYQLEQCGIQDANRELMHEEQWETGAAMWGHMIVPWISSTRAELAALVLAAPSANAIHIGIDNATVVNKASKLIGIASINHQCGQTQGDQQFLHPVGGSF